jgi:predicted PurR-regulated permease PerM
VRTFSTEPWKTTFAFAVAAGSVILVVLGKSALLLAFAGLLVAELLSAIADFGIRWLKVGRGVAVVGAAVLLLIGIGGALTLIASPLLKQGTEFVQSLPEKTARFSGELEHYRQEYPVLNRVLPANNPSEGHANGPPPTETAKKVLITASSALEWGARLLATFFFALFLAWNPERWMRGIAELWPANLVERRIAVFRCIGAALRSYLLTVGIAIVVMAVLWSLGLWVIGIKYALLFGAISGLVEIIPYVGPLLGLLPPLLYAVSSGGVKALYVLLLYCVLHVVEAYILIPLVLHERERFPAPLVVFSILLGGTLFGLLGVLLAVPLGTTVYVWLQEDVYKRRNA